MDASTRRLRIAQVAPLMIRVPPRRYGGTERVIHALTEELVARGHEVTLYATADTLTSGHLRACAPGPLWGRPRFEQLLHSREQVAAVTRDAPQFDLIHSHLDDFVALAGELPIPVVTTRHGCLDIPAQRQQLDRYRSPLISISDAQRRPVSGLELDWLATVYNGLPLRSLYRLGTGDGGYLVFLGRISPEKGPDTAIRVAIRAGIPIKVAARVDPHDMAFHRRNVLPYLTHPGVEWLGQLGDHAKARLLEGARALLMPITWDEPFGLVVIEALAAGTPVISAPLGALPELVRHGEHGFMCTGEEEMVKAAREVTRLSRVACREWALGRFSAEAMASGYERAYRRLLERTASAPSSRAPAEGAGARA